MPPDQNPTPPPTCPCGASLDLPLLEVSAHLHACPAWRELTARARVEAVLMSLRGDERGGGKYTAERSPELDEELASLPWECLTLKSSGVPLGISG